MTVKMLVGLGNPGPKYQWTRHNAGFMVLDRFSGDAGIPMARKGFNALYGEGSFGESRLLLLKPQTFMNLSGRAVAAALNFYKLSVGDLIVIHDELDIPFGRVKLKEDGGHAGHNGLRSIMQELGSGGFCRVRVGIGRPLHGDAADYVLTPFSGEELKGLPFVIDGVVDILRLLIDEGPRKAMSLYQSRDFLETP